MNNPRVTELIEKAVRAAGPLLAKPFQRLLICNKCGWAHVGITESFAREQSEDFEKYYTSLPEEKRQQYYPSGYDRENELDRQRKCFRCGNSHRDFSEAGPQHNIPTGCTVQGIIEYDPPISWIPAKKEKP